MKILDLDGSEFGEAPAWLVDEAERVPEYAAFAISFSGSTPVLPQTTGAPLGPPRSIAFVRLPRGLRFYAKGDKQRWFELRQNTA